MNKFKIIKYIGIDWGEKRIGLALGDSETKIATPYKVVSDTKQVLEIIKKEEIKQIIIGLPVKMDGKESISFFKVKEFISQLKNKTNIPIITVDERLTSQGINSLPGNKKTQAKRDAISAMFILQVYLDKDNINP